MIRPLVSRTRAVVTVLALIRSPQYSHFPIVGGVVSSPCFVSNKNTRFASTASASNLNMATTKRVLVPIADGSEEIETTCITDTLVRFGADVTVASVKQDGNLLCKMSRGIHIQADTTIAEASKEEWDMIALPGGMPGSEHLRDSIPLVDLLLKQKKTSKLYGAMCAAPAVVLATHNLLPEGGSATCYPVPAFRSKIAAVESNEDVVVSGIVTTSQGPGTALQFALQLGENLFGKEKRDEVAKALLVE